MKSICSPVRRLMPCSKRWKSRPHMLFLSWLPPKLTKYQKQSSVAPSDYTFKPVDTAKAVEHLKLIATQEKIKISNDALKLIAEHGEGSFRDSISLLDQARSTVDKVEVTDVQRMLGIAPSELYDLMLCKPAYNRMMPPSLCQTCRPFVSKACSRLNCQAVKSPIPTGIIT